MKPWTRTTYRWGVLGAISVTAVTGCSALSGGPVPVTVTVSPQAAVLAPEGSSSPGASTPPASEAPAPPRSQAPTTPAPSNDPAATWPETAQEVTSGIAKIHVVTGESGVTGSGFLIADDLLVTAARSSHRMVPLLVS